MKRKLLWRVFHYRTLADYYRQYDPNLHKPCKKKYDQLLRQWVEKWEEKLDGAVRLLSGKAGIRFFHAGDLEQEVDLYINDQKIVSKLPKGAVTNYVQIDEGDHWIQACPVGKKNEPVLSRLFSVRSGKVYTLVLWQENKSKKFTMLPFYDPLDIDPKKAKLRLIQLSPEMAPVDLLLNDKTVLFRNTAFTEATRYRILDPGRYMFAIRLSGTNRIVFRSAKPIQLRASQVVTVIVLNHPQTMLFIQDL